MAGMDTMPEIEGRDAFHDSKIFQILPHEMWMHIYPYT
jgi:hypothetical protein